MNEGQLYYLAHPDRSSLSIISEGHGYLWVSAPPPSRISSTLFADPTRGRYFASLATGVAYYFYFSEMRATETGNGEG
jgi:hypothetical protein